MISHRGFTLIELILVIVVIGVLAVVAAPKFLSLNRDANIATLKQVAAGLDQLTDGIYAKAVIQHKHKVSNESVTVNGVTVNTYFGAPQEIWNNALGDLMDGDFTYVGNGYFDLGASLVASYNCQERLCVIDQTPASYVNSSIQGWGLFIFPKGYSLQDECYAYYAFAENGSQVTSKVASTVDTGC
ncbi:MAG: type II secretion system protein [Pseudomonadota bacterium]|nr:type II secretion system protein [Pseudomonadota bacterium]